MNCKTEHPAAVQWVTNGWAIRYHCAKCGTTWEEERGNSAPVGRQHRSFRPKFLRVVK